MNIEVRQPNRAQKTRYDIVDCDIHPKMLIEDYRKHLSNQWWSHLQTYGLRPRHGYTKAYPMPKITPQAARRDAWPPTGGMPGSDLGFMQEQLLDLYDMDYGILNPLQPTGQGDQNPEFSAALAFAANEQQLERWTLQDKRLKASVVVPYENPDASKAEIKRRAGSKDFAQVFMLSRAAEAHGRRRYWPIYEAVVASMIFEGLFEQYRDLKVVLIESGFGWLPALGWRLDKHWERMRDDVPHVKRPPSEYIREHFWVSTQPMEEAEDPEHVMDAMKWIGFDRILFASDYPHWDFDDPVLALPPALTEEQRRMIYGDNAKKLYGLS